MGMFSFLFPNNKEQSSIVFDINAESVGAAIVLSKDNSIPRIIYMCRESFRDGKGAERTARQTIDAMQNAFLRIENFLAKNVFSHPIFRSYTPISAHYTFSEPWLESKIKTVTIEYSSPTLVTEKLISTIVEKEVKVFKQELIDKLGGGKTHFTIVENKITSIRLNGYEVEEYVGTKAKTVDVSLYISAIPTEIRDAVAFPAAGKVHPKKNYYASFSSAITEVVKQNVAEKEFVVLDILGPMTQAFIVRHGLLAAQVTIPVGDNMLINTVAKRLSVSHMEAVSLLKMFFRDHAEHNSALEIKKITTETRSLWRKEFETTINTLAEKISVPPLFFVLARSDEAPFFVRALRRESILEFGVDRIPVRQTLLTEELLKSKISVDQDVSGDIVLSLLCAYFTSKRHYQQK